jgi:hypothetical protein
MQDIAISLWFGHVFAEVVYAALEVARFTPSDAERAFAVRPILFKMPSVSGVVIGGQVTAPVRPR